MAEFLIKKAPNWKDEWDATKVASLTERERAKYDRRSRPGDFIVVKPSGHVVWGREEGPPAFVVLKVKDAEVKDVEYLLKPKTRPLTQGEITKEIVDYVNEKQEQAIKENKIVDSEELANERGVGIETETVKLIKHRYAIDLERMNEADKKDFEDGKTLIWDLAKLQSLIVEK